MTYIFAHRGYSALYPENTMLAFKKAEKAGAHGIELDVQLSKDGEVVVIHDEKVNRTTNGRGYVKDLSYQELKKFYAGSKKSILKKTSIPSLREVLEWMKKNKLICNIELKNGVFPYEGMEEKVIQLIREFGLSDRIILSSFNHYSLVHCNEIAPEIETAPLMADGIYRPWVYAKSIMAKGIHPKYSSLTDDVLLKSLENEMAVRPYTVNKEKEMVRLFSLGCTAIITDEPVLALSIQKQHAQKSSFKNSSK
jgi:glycerophosphoryl diester phosphodiesterase